MHRIQLRNELLSRELLTKSQECNTLAGLEQNHLTPFTQVVLDNRQLTARIAELEADRERLLKAFNEAGMTIATVKRVIPNLPNIRVLFNGVEVSYQEMCDLTLDILRTARKETL